MSAPLWQSGFVYIPGDVVRPVTQSAFSDTSLVNPGFEDGDTAWDKLTGAVIVEEAGSFAGDWHAKFAYTDGSGGAVRMTTPIAVDPGQSITATCMIQATGPDQTGGDINLLWLDDADATVRSDEGNEINASGGSAYRKSSVTGVCPAGATKVRIQIDFFALNAGGVVRADNVVWNYVTASAANSGLVYRAVQPEPGTSGGVEPAWPSVLGQTVVDNQVTWEAISSSFVTWEANPLFVSGATEPTWPTQVGEFVSDGTIAWEAVSRRVTDENCPNSKVVAIAASKVFGADGDIVRFSATANPLDWTTAEDAGYLPTGLQQANANDMAVLNIYRSNVVAMNPNCFQMWQVDPDPTMMAHLDQMDGVGSNHQRAAQPVANDLLYLSQQGVRSVGIANAAENLQAGDVGAPIDDLILATIASVGTLVRPISTYYPGAGQYWLAFTQGALHDIAITGAMDDGEVGDAGTFQYTINGGLAPVTCAVTAGALPPDSSIDDAGLVTFDYTTAGDYTWTITATGADGNTATVDDGITVLSIGWVVSSASHASGLGSVLVTDDPADFTGTPQTITGTLGAQTARVIYGSGRLLAWGVSASPLCYSTDAGATWAEGYTLPAVSGGYRGAHDGTNFLIPMGGNLYVTADGITASQITGWQWDGIIDAGSRLVSWAVNNGSYDRAFYSTDGGTTWQFAAGYMSTSGSGFGVANAAMATDGTDIVLVYDGAAPVMRRSTDGGESWTTISCPFVATTGGMYVIDCDGTNWVCVNNAGAIAYSADGATWTLSASSLGAVPRDIHHGNEVWVLVGNGGACMTSTDDGATWATEATGFGAINLTGVTSFGGAA